MSRDPHTTPWHQRLMITRAARSWARRRFFDAARAAFRTDSGRAILTETLGDLLAWRPRVPPAAFAGEVPYDLGCATPTIVRHGARPIIVSARFRSGSTLVWNLFRQIPSCTAYYEPLNERRWFDPAARGGRVDSTHHVDDYWREYDGLQELEQYYREDWIRRGLYMDETSWDPDLRDYIRTLIERARARPVLQFNRVDFRLSWLRATFPDALLVHLYRHPRDQWCSTFPSVTAAQVRCRLDEFANNDHFYLLIWANDLKDRFPFLDPVKAAHPYRIFYYVWRLSLIAGQSVADHSFSFDALVANPEPELRRLFDAVALDGVDLGELCRLIRPSPPRWPQYADDAWFREHEQVCENVLSDFFRTQPRIF